MFSKILRAVLIVLLSLFVARFIWIGFTVRESGKVIGKTQVKIAMNDVKRIRLALDFLWASYDLGEEDGKTYTTKSYPEFKNRIEKIADSRGGMPFVLPTGQNFTGFSYEGHDKGYHISVRAKDKNGTVVHGTRARLWHE
jgi:hypothetical protein